MKNLLLIQSISGIIFMFLVMFTMNDNIIIPILSLYSVTYAPALILSVHVFNKYINSDSEKESN